MQQRRPTINLPDRTGSKKHYPRNPASTIPGTQVSGSGAVNLKIGNGNPDTGDLTMISMRLRIDGAIPMFTDHGATWQYLWAGVIIELCGIEIFWEKAGHPSDVPEDALFTRVPN